MFRTSGFVYLSLSKQTLKEWNLESGFGRKREIDTEKGTPEYIESKKNIPVGELAIAHSARDGRQVSNSYRTLSYREKQLGHEF